MFDFYDATVDLGQELKAKSSLRLVISSSAIYGISATFKTLIIFLLITNSIGVNTFRTAYVFSISYGMAVAITLATVMYFDPGYSDQTTIPQVQHSSLMTHTTSFRKSVSLRT